MRAFFLSNLILLIILISGATLADPMTDEPKPAPAPDRQENLSPRMVEIRTTLEETRLQVAELQQQLEDAADEEQALALLRAISECKQEGEIAVLRIQEKYARQAGNDEAVQQITRAINAILNPEPVKPDPAAKAQRAERGQTDSSAQTGGGSHE